MKKLLIEFKLTLLTELELVLFVNKYSLLIQIYESHHFYRHACKVITTISKTPEIQIRKKQLWLNLKLLKL